MCYGSMRQIEGEISLIDVKPSLSEATTRGRDSLRLSCKVPRFGGHYILYVEEHLHCRGGAP